jgi:hypothetical protein
MDIWDWLHEHSYLATWAAAVFAFVTIVFDRLSKREKPVRAPRVDPPPMRKIPKRWLYAYAAAGVEVLIAVLPIAETSTRIYAGVFAALILFFVTFPD